MKPSMLIPVGALLCALGGLWLLASATAQPTASATSRTASQTPVCDSLGIHNGADFVKTKVLVLSSTYDPSSGIGPSASQIIGGITPSSPFWKYQKDLAAAFRTAPPFFRDALCGLTYVFLVECADAAHCAPEDAIQSSWGLREWKGAKSGTYIAVSAALWQNTDSALTLDQFKTKRLMQLLHSISPSADLSKWPSPPTYSPALINNNSEMSVLATLAHEMGHVLWYDKFVPDRGGNIDLNNFCSGFYPPNSWSSVNVTQRRWIDFGDQISNETHNPDYINMLANDLSPTSPNFNQAGEDLNKIFSDQSLTGTLAAISPDEDFVETYMLYVLLSAKSNNTKQLQKFIISITGNGNTYTPDIANIYNNKSFLLAKMSCFGNLPPP